MGPPQLMISTQTSQTPSVVRRDGGYRLRHAMTNGAPDEKLRGYVCTIEMLYSMQGKSH